VTTTTHTADPIGLDTDATAFVSQVLSVCERLSVGYLTGLAIYLAGVS
jgi:hypothetical protein